MVVFLHGSSGNKLAAIGVWQQWLAAQGIASIAPDSFALADRITYTSPVDKTTCEHIHALRESEIAPAAAAVGAQPWADTGKRVLAGTSEGSVAVSRYTGHAFAARILYSWSCESNCFVTEPRTAALNIPTLNVISASDPCFSAKSGYVGNVDAKGHCGAALKDNPQASVALIPDAPHTLLNTPATQQITREFLMSALQLNGRN